MEFTPKEEVANPFDVPYYDDVSSEGGWVGHTAKSRTKKTIMSSITQGMTKLGATIIDFQEGTFGEGTIKPREGFIIRFTINGAPGQTKIAALPVKPLKAHTTQKAKQGHKTKRKKSIIMALYMFDLQIQGMWYAQKLSPGYLPLVPFMLDENSGMTFSELYASNMPLSLPDPGEKPIDGEFEEVE